jgi:single-strand DNA-binding protein
MANLNKVMLIGNLTRDPELKYTPGNQAVCEIGLAVNRKYRTKDGEDREDTTFVDCEAWGKQAEVIKQYMAKGRPIYIEGRLKLDTWEDKNGGGKRSKMRVVVEEFQFLGGGGAGGGGAGGGERYVSDDSGEAPRGRGGRAPAAAGGRGGASHADVPEEDIPF